MKSNEYVKIGRVLFAASITYLISIILFIFTPIIVKHLYNSYIMAFIIRTISSFCMSIIIFSLFLIGFSKSNLKLQNLIAFSSLTAFFVLVIFCYASQFIFLNSIMLHEDSGLHLYFIRKGLDITYLLLLGYFFWSIGSLIIALQFLQLKEVEKSVGGILLITAIIIAFLFISLFFINENDIKNIVDDMQIVIGGLIFIPFIAGSLLLGNRYKKVDLIL